MVTVVCIASVIIGTAALEKRYVAHGDAAAARTVKQFGRWFLIGSGAYVVWVWAVAVLALIA
ncbi:hypothetical protein AB4Z45_12555 [Paenibacillus sp. MCAF9]|uniref:hypothetical protein n=1 Tax=Paenibacillus sp. MCAF9 TaxID=3233046 RepID=UPI003F959B28